MAVRVTTYGKDNRKGLERAIDCRRDFTTGGALWGEWCKPPFLLGNLPDDYASELESLTRGYANSVEHVYIVYSYSTPIAWFKGHYGWTVPDVRYSVTTSKHQGYVRTAIARGIL